MRGRVLEGEERRQGGGCRRGKREVEGEGAGGY